MSLVAQAVRKFKQNQKLTPENNLTLSFSLFNFIYLFIYVNFVSCFMFVKNKKTLGIYKQIHT